MEAILQNVKQAGARGLGAPLVIMMLLAMIVLPLPPFLLDLFFTFNIALSLVVLLVVVYALRPLDFGLFPSMLLVATLLRLALNVASTRVVLLEGHAGPDAAGKVIEAFGEFVIGGNYAVGLVVFLILLINIIGGLAIGMGQHGLDMATATHNYVLLTIGDGLVAQIPSLLLSTAAAIIVTRVFSSEDMGNQVATQLLENPRSLAVAAGIIGVLARIFHPLLAFPGGQWMEDVVPRTGRGKAREGLFSRLQAHLPLTPLFVNVPGQHSPEVILAPVAQPRCRTGVDKGKRLREGAGFAGYCARRSRQL